MATKKKVKVASAEVDASKFESTSGEFVKPSLSPLKLTKDKVLKNFPLEKPRDLQVDAIEQMCTAYNNGAQYVILEAPVGTGKSALAAAMARTMGNKSYMLTLTEQLQEQYVRDFSKFGMSALKGRGKFSCHTLGKGATCSDGKHLSPKCKGCPYTTAKQVALSSPHVIANYHSYHANVAMAATQTEDGEDTPVAQRPLTVIDEAHAMEGFLLDAVSLTVRLQKIPVKVESIPDSLDDVEPYLNYIREELLPKGGAEMKRAVDPKVKDELRVLYGKLAMVLRSEEVQWIPERGRMQDGKSDPSWFSLKPLYVDRWGPELYGRGERLLLMSGTILSAFQFVKSVGLNPDEGHHICLDSPFPAENRPIYIDSLNMTKKARDESWPLMAQKVDAIMSAHKNEKGLLLCPSNEMLKYIQMRLSRVNNGRLIFAAGEKRMEQYQKHMVSKAPTVLAASGFWEGADLKGDASRFQIIPALPRPMWHGQVAARASAPGGDPWYRWMTMQKFLQGTGRSVRSETDTAATYVFDVGLRAELNRKDSMVPGWVKKACHIVDPPEVE